MAGPSSLRLGAGVEHAAVKPAPVFQRKVVVPGTSVTTPLSTKQVSVPTSSVLSQVPIQIASNPVSEDVHPQNLPSFLRRKKDVEVNQQSTDGAHATEATTTKSLKDQYGDEMRHRGVDIDDDDLDALVDAAGNEDSDEEAAIGDDDDDATVGEDKEISEQELMRLADDMMSTTGLTHAEVVLLLKEFEEAKRQARTAKKQKKTFFVTHVDSPQKAKKNKLVKPVPVVPMSLPKLPTTGDETTKKKPRGALAAAFDAGESGAERMQLLLDELFPNGPGGKAPQPYDEDTAPGESLDEMRRRVALQRHKAVADYVARKRGAVAAPTLAQSDEKYVSAYKEQLEKRVEKFKEKQAALKVIKDEELRAKREKGFMSNQAIKKQIEEAGGRTGQPKPVKGYMTIKMTNKDGDENET